MKFTRSKVLPDVIMIEPSIYKDSRGYFFEGFQARRYQEIGIKETFVQDNYSRSVKNTLRGLHYQLDNPQGKLVGVTAGRVFDVIVDIRQGSPTFGQWIGVELSDDNARQVYIPKGYAHGFCVLSETADFYYKCTDYYVPNDDYGIKWNDSRINIEWPIKGVPIVSAKDDNYGSLLNVKGDQLPKYLPI
jgi:dTDP-4-dehydrorhamnose 3,5-epimerase